MVWLVLEVDPCTVTFPALVGRAVRAWERSLTFNFKAVVSSILE
jgi:hypothetical protein